MLALLACIAAFDRWMATMSNRLVLGQREVPLTFAPVRFDPTKLAPLRLAGAWQLSSPDPRLGGISALAFASGKLLAVTDSGVTIRFAPPTRRSRTAWIAELPSGPSNGRFKGDRDSESLARDPRGRDWWVGFERHHQLWRYDPNFTRALGRVQLQGGSWHANGGVEAMVAVRGRLLLFVETGSAVLSLDRGKLTRVRLSGQRGTITDAVALRDGRLLAIDRELTPFGFRTRLVRLARAGRGLTVAGSVRLPLRPIDNLEGLAVEPRADGGTRLWLVTDDNFELPFRTLLIAIDLPH